eukprot:TRINITY_DN121569_c0_g1_i1.p1 TRINITY_DN121569_c0_g1~~TRINITY_DN121569_c0_g1_i1.p1  ORF type:complete len:512 (-),score=39.39 TRINITY_DN121569_c0_g1_i1:116-1609(-)
METQLVKCTHNFSNNPPLFCPTCRDFVCKDCMQTHPHGNVQDLYTFWETTQENVQKQAKAASYAKKSIDTAASSVLKNKMANYLDALQATVLETEENCLRYFKILKEYIKIQTQELHKTQLVVSQKRSQVISEFEEFENYLEGYQQSMKTMLENKDYAELARKCQIESPPCFSEFTNFLASANKSRSQAKGIFKIVQEKLNEVTCSIKDVLKVVTTVALSPLQMGTKGPMAYLHNFDMAELHIYSLYERTETVCDIEWLNETTDFASLQVGKYIYVCGGSCYPIYLDCTYQICCGSKLAISSKAPMKVPKNRHSLAQIQEKYIYCVGGYNHIMGIMKNCEKYLIAQNKWVFIKPLNYKISNVSLCTINDREVITIPPTAEGKQIQMEILDVYEEDNGWFTLTIEKGYEFLMGVQVGVNELLIFDESKEVMRRISKEGHSLKYKEGIAYQGEPDKVFFYKGNLFAVYPEGVDVWSEVSKSWTSKEFTKRLVCLQQSYQ